MRKIKEVCSKSHDCIGCDGQRVELSKFQTCPFESQLGCIYVCSLGFCMLKFKSLEDCENSKLF